MRRNPESTKADTSLGLSRLVRADEDHDIPEMEVFDIHFVYRETFG
jgi:hypothetical protein